MIFRLYLLEVEINWELCWLGKFFIKGFFDGEYYFCIYFIFEGYLCFEYGENFRGLLVGLLIRMIGVSI